MDLASALRKDPWVAAPMLLGAVVEFGEVRVRLTEVEAYGGADDPGSHAYRGRTRRNAAMFGEPGTAYVYLSYGMHWCLNVTCGEADRPAAVLLRAGEVTAGLERVRERRRLPSGVVPGDRDLARGPARLTRALAVTGDHDGGDLLAGSGLRLVPGVGPTGRVASGPRVGVSGAGAPTPWRFWLADDPTVSPYRPGRPRGAGRQA